MYDGEHNFDVILDYVVPRRKHSNGIVRQVETPGIKYDSFANNDCCVSL